MTEQENADRAIAARQVLENSAYRSAHTMLQAEIVAQWEQCPIRDQEGQRLLLQLFRLAKKFDGMLAGMVESGKLSQVKIDAERDESRVKTLFRKVL